MVARRDPGAPPGWRPLSAFERWGATTLVTLRGVRRAAGDHGSDRAAVADAGGAADHRGPFDHIAHMITYAEEPDEPPRARRGSPPTPGSGCWTSNRSCICGSTRRCRATNSIAIHPVSAFIGMMSPPIMFPGAAGAGVLPSYCFTAPARVPESPSQSPSGIAQLAIVGVAWFLGTWVPFALQSLLDQRHQLHLLHGGRDARDLCRGHIPGGARVAPSQNLAVGGDSGVGAHRRGGGGAHVSVRSRRSDQGGGDRRSEP